MCGIFFYYSKSVCKNVESLFENITHRGPDDTKLVYLKDNAVMGFHRLSINGTTSQPIVVGALHLICNGEIYNYKKLALDHNIKLETDSDCEIILHLYKKYGIEKTIPLLNSESAFVIYDDINNKFVYSRDHLGIRPLFIGKSEDEIFLTSELKAIPNYMNAYQLPAGYGINWDYYPTKRVYQIDKTIEYKDHIQDRIVYDTIKYYLTNAVLDRLMSNRKIGAFLSGGLDSSLIVSILSRFTKNIDIFTIGLEGSPDITAAKQVCEYLNLKNHHIVKYTVEEGIKYLPDVIKSIESYDITTVRASIPQWILSKYIKENTDTTVLFSGECIDEMIGYYYLKFLDDKNFIKETTRMLDELYLYDLLRTDRTTAAHSLEVRIPFADKTLINYIMSLPLCYRKFGDVKSDIPIKLDQSGKVSNKTDLMEKHLIRNAFKGYLPDNILWRKKHAFSDSVSGNDISWYKSIEEHAKKTITPDEYKNKHIAFPINTPVSYESYLYRKIFANQYPNRENVIPHFWLPKIPNKNIIDPSATILDGFIE
jgi:asparagine synthase (glutamine-hydrolysing)